MFKATGNVLSLEIDSEVTDARFRAICAEIEQLTASPGKIRLVLIMRYYPSFNSAEDLYYDLRFVTLYADRIEKAAIICDQAWEHTLVGLFGLFSGVKMEFFDASETGAAADWIRAD